jgi:hypothetical protein
VSRYYRTPIERKNAAPPVSQRPRCPQCDRPLRPYWWTLEWRRVDDDSEVGWHNVRVVEWRGEYQGPGAFCTNNCAIVFANRVILQTRRERA